MDTTAVGLVMLIDDNPTDRFVHRKLLEIHEISSDIIEFEGAKDALKYLRNSDADRLIPDLILLDVMMPDMDGFGFLVHYSNLIDNFKKKPLIFMLSSTDNEKDIQRVRKDANVIKMLRKPFSPASLKKSLSEL